MNIDRNTYLEKIIARKHNGMIKVITGIRRCGKSYLLFKIFREHLREVGVDDNHIMSIALDDMDNKELRSDDKMFRFIKNQIRDDKMHYLFIDEVQMLENFEDVLNSCLHINNLDVYVTGSNSKFLSSDIITEFRGRGDEIRIFPLVFSEFMSVCAKDKYDGWNEFITYGGMPHVLSLNSDEQKSEYLKNIFAKVYLTDIIDRNKIKNTLELEELVDILASAIGSCTNPNKLVKTFNSLRKNSMSHKTIKNYLDYLEDSFILEKAYRYDVKGKSYINTPMKYYFADIGLRNAKLNFRQQEETHIMENVIYNELRYRGYSVDVGVIEINDKNSAGEYQKKQLEVDFIASRGSEKFYIQSALQLPTDEKKIQEERPLNAIKDSFKKIVVVKDHIKLKRDEMGIVTMGIYEFLLNDNSLYL